VDSAVTNRTSYIKVSWSLKNATVISCGNYVVSINIDGEEYVSKVKLFSMGCGGKTGEIVVGNTTDPVKFATGNHDITLTIKTDKGNVTSKKTTINVAGSCCPPADPTDLGSLGFEETLIGVMLGIFD
jgi:hypothetical protein